MRLTRQTANYYSHHLQLHINTNHDGIFRKHADTAGYRHVMDTKLYNNSQ